MYFSHLALLACVGVLIFQLGPTEASSSNKKRSESRSDCDHILPLMMMLGGPPTAHLPSCWLLGVLSLGVIALFGGSGNLWNWKSQERKRKE